MNDGRRQILAIACPSDQALPLHHPTNRRGTARCGRADSDLLSIKTRRFNHRLEDPAAESLGSDTSEGSLAKTKDVLAIFFLPVVVGWELGGRWHCFDRLLKAATNVTHVPCMRRQW